MGTHDGPIDMEWFSRSSYRRKKMRKNMSKAEMNQSKGRGTLHAAFRGNPGINKVTFPCRDSGGIKAKPLSIEFLDHDFGIDLPTEIQGIIR